MIELIKGMLSDLLVSIRLALLARSIVRQEDESYARNFKLQLIVYARQVYADSCLVAFYDKQARAYASQQVRTNLAKAMEQRYQSFRKLQDLYYSDPAVFNMALEEIFNA